MNSDTNRMLVMMSPDVTAYKRWAAAQLAAAWPELVASGDTSSELGRVIDQAMRWGMVMAFDLIGIERPAMERPGGAS